VAGEKKIINRYKPPRKPAVNMMENSGYICWQ